MATRADEVNQFNTRCRFPRGDNLNRPQLHWIAVALEPDLATTINETDRQFIDELNLHFHVGQQHFVGFKTSQYS